MENEELNRYIPDTERQPLSDAPAISAPEPITQEPESNKDVLNPSTSDNETVTQTPAARPPQANPQKAPAYQPAYKQPAYKQPAYNAAANRYAPATPKKEKRKGVSVLAVIAIALLCSIFGGLIGAFGYALVQPFFKVQYEKTPAPSTSIDTSETDITNMFEGLREDTEIDITQIYTSKQLTPAEVYAKNVNSTVGITTSITTNYWGFQSTSAASGSGFIISDDGYILTNFHVIENSNAITVAMFDGTEYDAKLVGYDERNDIAVLKIEAENLVPVIMGDSDSLNVGDPVIAIGNPLGELTFSLTSGAVSAKDRTVTMSNGITMELIQTDCAINSGNSGGALFNLYGEVVGITNAKYSSSNTGASIDNIGFAIPLNDVRKIVESIIEKGYVSKPFIGVSVTDVGEESLLYGLPAGASVRAITEGSPAEKCGLKEGDIITHVNGQEITGHQDLASFVEDCEVGDELILTVFRRNNTIELKLTVGEQIQSATNSNSTQIAP